MTDASVTNAGDALRELDKRNLIQSDPFILMTGDVVTNVDIVPALEQHKKRHKKDSSAIMTVLLKEVGGWSVDSDEKDPSKQIYRASALRSLKDDLIVALNTASPAGNRILSFDSDPSSTITNLPTSFFAANSQIELRNDMLDTGIYICSPDVLARFSDEFDYLHIRKFISNSVAEEEEGLQSKIYASILKPTEYAARIHDPRTYHKVSSDLLQRWCYPIVPDNLPSGYDKLYRYDMRRHMMYVEQKQKAKVGRSASVKGPGMIGSLSRVEHECTISRTVIGKNCYIGRNATISNSHLWDNVVVEDDATVIESIICHNAIVKKGAIVSKGCIVGNGCVIGENFTLPPFTRVTVHQDQEEEDDFHDFGDENDSFSSSGSSSSGSGSSSGESSSDDDSSTEDVNDKALTSPNQDKTEQMAAATSSGAQNAEHALGKDGRGRIWTPTYEEFGAIEDDSDFDSDDEEEAVKKAIKLVQTQSIGFDPTSLFHNRLQRQNEDDCLSDDDHEEDEGFDEGNGNRFDGGGDGYGGISHHNLDEDGFLITGRQAGVDVVKEMKLICLDHEISSPIENLRIELNSFKFSQNASFGECVTGAMLAIFERLKLTPDVSAAKLVSSFKTELDHWGQLLEKLCHTIEEEKSIIQAIEIAATGGGATGEVLSREPSFRFILQTLHSEEIVTEEAILSWAKMCKEEGDTESARGKLFLQQPTQEFLEWLDEDSGSDSSDDSDSSSDSD